MKAKVIKRFRDKHSKLLFSPGDVYEGDKSRLSELEGLGFVQVERSILDGNVNQVKEAVNKLDKDELAKLLDDEKQNENRKGVIEHIKGLLESE